MALHKIEDFNPDYKKHFGDRDIKGLDLYAANEKIGSVDDVLVDDGGQFRYLVISTGSWITGKKVLLPIGRAHVDKEGTKVFAHNLTKAQVEALPEFTNDLKIDYEHEEQVRGVYRSAASMQQDRPPATGTEYAKTPPMPTGTSYDRNTYTYDKEPDLYNLNEQNHSSLKLYEERLVTSTTRQKTGEAVIGKHIEMETATASVPVEKERITIERMPGNAQAVVNVSDANFQAGEVARMEVFEEVPEFHKEAFVREEVRVSKVIDKETVTAQEQLRREELDVNIDGHPVIENIDNKT
jgi:uncharacterized protein (TIGR02271 family)